MTDRELMQQALDALERLQTDIAWQYKSPTRAMLRKIEKALRDRLAQPEREWQGLTDEEQIQVAWSCGAMSADWLDFANAIEAKLKEKNT